LLATFIKTKTICNIFFMGAPGHEPSAPAWRNFVDNGNNADGGDGTGGDDDCGGFSRLGVFAVRHPFGL
jgi:hypothetical protein